MSETSEKYGLDVCPFCGSDNLEIRNMSSSVKCNGCGIMCTISSQHIVAFGRGKENRIAGLIACWNRRNSD